MNTLLEKEKERITRNPFVQYNHIQVSDIRPDYAEVYLDIVEESHNFIGTVQGGIYFAMADFCAGMAARTDGGKYVTQNAQVNYVKAAREGRITARCHVLHRGRSGCLLDVDIRNESDELMFTARMFFYAVNR